MDFKTMLQQRRTVRFFRQTPIKSVQLEELIDAATKASCAANQQRLRYITVQGDSAAELHKLCAFAALVKPCRSSTLGVNAPTAFIAVLGPVNANAVIQADAGAAIQSMEFAACNIGLGMCWIGAFEREKTEKLLAPPEGYTILYLLAVGVPAEQPVRDDIDESGDVRYYLDEENTLHVPKYTAASLILKRLN